MKISTIIKELRKIQAGIEGDSFTADNLEDLIRKLSKRGEHEAK